jgi:hypothetical protein
MGVSFNLERVRSRRISACAIRLFVGAVSRIAKVLQESLERKRGGVDRKASTAGYLGFEEGDLFSSLCHVTREIRRLFVVVVVEFFVVVDIVRSTSTSSAGDPVSFFRRVGFTTNGSVVVSCCCCRRRTVASASHTQVNRVSVKRIIITSIGRVLVNLQLLPPCDHGEQTYKRE